MSDTWYRDPPDLPPFEDGFGKLWTFDGRCLNPDPAPPRGQIATWEEFRVFVSQRMDEIVADALFAEALDGGPPITWGHVVACMDQLPRTYR